MCETTHPLADAAGLGGASHDHEEAAEAQLDAASAHELGSEEQDTALELARVEALLALARNVGRIASVLENETKHGGALDILGAALAGRQS